MKIKLELIIEGTLDTLTALKRGSFKDGIEQDVLLSDEKILDLRWEETDKEML